MISCIMNMIKAFLFTFLGLLRRVLCFWKKSENHQSGIPSFDANAFQGQDLRKGEVAWDSWDDNPSEIVVDGGRAVPETVADHISAYRQSLQQARQRKEEEEAKAKAQAELDLFSDLTPEVKQQKKVYVGPTVQRRQSGRLSMQESAVDDPILLAGDELTEWGRTEDAGWAVEDEDLSEVLREQKRLTKLRNQ